MRHFSASGGAGGHRKNGKAQGGAGDGHARPGCATAGAFSPDLIASTGGKQQHSNALSGSSGLPSSSKCSSQRGGRLRSGLHAEDAAVEVVAAAGAERGEGGSGDDLIARTLDLFARADGPLRLEQEMARRSREEEKFVYPWVVVVVNLDVERWQLSAELWQAKLKRLLYVFNPKEVKFFQASEPQSVSGVAAIMFERDLEAFCDADALEMRFQQSGRGRKEWEKIRHSAHCNPCKDLYGWVARREDYYADSPVGKFLFDYGELKTVAVVGDEKMKKYSQRFQHTVDTTAEKWKYQLQCLENELVAKNKELQALDRRVEGLENALLVTEKIRKRLEEEQVHVAEVHKSELESVNLDMKKIQDECSHTKLEKANLLKGFEVELEAERKKNESARREMQRRMHMLSESHKKTYSDLIRKHERDLKGLQESHKKKMWEATQHKVELEKLRALVKKQKIGGEKDLRSEHSQGKDSYKSSPDKQISESTATVKREVNECQPVDLVFLQDRLKEGTDEKEGLHVMVNSLLRKEREMSEELEQSRRVAVEILEKHGSRERIGVKRMGELDSAPWKVACKRKYKDGWESHFLRISTEWEQLVRSSDWRPFKVNPVGDEDEWKEVLDQDDKRLLLLRQELGKAVCKTVTNALSELEEFNATGRHPVPVAFNFEQYRKASLKEVLQYLEEIIENGKIAKRRKRHRQDIG